MLILVSAKSVATNAFRVELISLVYLRWIFGTNSISEEGSSTRSDTFGWQDTQMRTCLLLNPP